MSIALCPQCGHVFLEKYRNPYPSADILIYDEQRGLVLIERANEPRGMAIPGGFIDEGETVEHAALREMKEETSLEGELLGILGVYSRPDRDPRFHTMTVTFVVKPYNPEALAAGDDAAKAAFYPLDALPASLCFDHDLALAHFFDYLAGKRPLLPCVESGEV